MLEKTNLFDSEEIQKALISKTLFEVYEALKEKGYNPTAQIVGYLISGDPGYISSYKDARNKIISIDRVQIVLAILEDYLEI